ncbi:MAG: DUF2752 domain-containing protein [Myxococcota bacterium]
MDTPKRGWLDRLVAGPYPWFLWPSALVLLAAGSIAAAIVFYPALDGDPTRVMVAGTVFGGECGMKTALGLPCPQCGMTRSWVYLVRGRVLDAFTFNAAGALLLLWIAAAGLIGAIRLVTGREKLLRPPWIALFSWAMFWIAVPYLGLWIARCAGFNILPEYM